jgi:6-pyruvoyltetrahydropterin/6-carboxytetrahydropterin synthase
MIYIERTESFSAAHQLYNPRWSEEQNDAVFGKCANRAYHGHNFKLTVVVKGEVNPDTGFVLNLVDLKQVMMDHVIDHVDHKNLNVDVPFLAGQLPSTENLAIAFWSILAPRIADLGAVLHCIRLRETDKNAVEYYGE